MEVKANVSKQTLMYAMLAEGNCQKPHMSAMLAWIGQDCSWLWNRTDAAKMLRAASRDAKPLVLYRALKVVTACFGNDVVNIPEEGTGYVALHFAAENGLDSLLYMLEYADMEAADNNGWTALTCAIGARRYDNARLLLERGARYNGEGRKSALIQLLHVTYINNSELELYTSVLSGLLTQLEEETNAAVRVRHLTALLLAPDIWPALELVADRVCQLQLKYATDLDLAGNPALWYLVTAQANAHNICPGHEYRLVHRLILDLLELDVQDKYGSRISSIFCSATTIQAACIMCAEHLRQPNPRPRKRKHNEAFEGSSSTSSSEEDDENSSSEDEEQPIL
jgi:hypothetical protein